MESAAVGCAIHSSLFVDADVEDVGGAEDAGGEHVVFFVFVVFVAWRANAHGDGGGGETTNR